jgi:hypothetical protein
MCSPYCKWLYRVLVETSEDKSVMGDPGVDVRMDLQELGGVGVDWVGLTQDRAGGEHL